MACHGERFNAGAVAVVAEPGVAVWRLVCDERDLNVGPTEAATNRRRQSSFLPGAPIGVVFRVFLDVPASPDPDGSRTWFRTPS